MLLLFLPPQYGLVGGGGGGGIVLIVVGESLFQLKLFSYSTNTWSFWLFM
jgi:hypothetical protein